MSKPQVDKSIRIEGSAFKSTIISGDHNTVYVIHQTVKQRLEEIFESSTTDIGLNPYRGLAAFDERDAKYYFGREAQVERLWQRFQVLYEQNRVPRFLPIVGPSGCGKSSLARAGLLPELARRPLPAKKAIRVATLVPGINPIKALATVLTEINSNDTLIEKFISTLMMPDDTGEHVGLWQIASRISDIQDVPLVILVDQFEEIYSLCQDTHQRQAFISNLLHAATKSIKLVSVIVSLRSDFLTETQQHECLNQIVGSDQSMIVPAMTAEEIRRAITEPAKQQGYLFDESVIDLIVKDTEGREGALPLLQFALTQIWEGLKNGIDPFETYKNMGEVGGALAGKAQAIYDLLPEAEKQVAKRVFLGLVQLGEGTRDTRRRVAVKSLATAYDTTDTLQKVIQQFSSPTARLISLSSLNGQEVAEVTHEALFENWKLLNKWLDSNRDDIRQLRRLEDAAKLWKESNQNTSYLLKGHQLEVAKEAYKRCEKDATLDIKEFIEASVEQQYQEQKIAKIKRRRSIASLTTIFISTVATAGLGFYSYTQIQKNLFQEQLTQVLYGGVTEPELLPVLFDSIDLAERQKNEMRLDESLISYQATLTAAQNFQSAAILNPEKFGIQKQKEIEDIWIKAEKDLTEIILKNRINSLSKALDMDSIGYLNSSSSYTDFENQFSEGALRETYKLLMRPWGAGADLNDSGSIENRTEAERLPCDLIKAIETMWKDATDQKCSWHGEDFYQDLDCQKLQGQTLAVIVFPPPIDFVVERIDFCFSSDIIKQ